MQFIRQHINEPAASHIFQRLIRSLYFRIIIFYRGSQISGYYFACLMKHSNRRSFIRIYIAAEKFIPDNG